MRAYWRVLRAVREAVPDMPSDYDDSVLMLVNGMMVSAATLMQLTHSRRQATHRRVTSELEDFPTSSPMHKGRVGGRGGGGGGGVVAGDGIEMRFVFAAGDDGLGGNGSDGDDGLGGNDATAGSTNSYNWGGIHGRLSPHSRGSFVRSSAVV